jgi:signal transduction histidine kinase
LPEAAYRALKGAVWHLVASRDTGPHVDLWEDVILRVRGLLRSIGSTLADRFTVLADLLDQSARFATFQSKEELKNRKHVGAILELLARYNAPVERSVVAKETGLRDANLSRILANLASAGWIVRRYEGRQLYVGLTNEGLEAARLPLREVDLKTEDVFDGRSIRLLKTMWPETDCALAIAEDSLGVTFCDRNFASLFGVSKPETLHGEAIASLRERLLSMRTGSGATTAEEVSAPDGRVRHVVEYSKDGLTLWLGTDITLYKKAIEQFRRRERLLLEEIDQIKRRINRRDEHVKFVGPYIARAPDAAVCQMLTALRNEVITPLNSINCLAQVIRSKAHGPSGSYEEHIAEIISYSDRLRTLMRDLLNIGEVWSVHRPPIDRCMPRQLVEEVVGNFHYTNKISDLTLFTDKVSPEPIKCDGRALRAVFLQMLAGVVEMTPPGACVEIASEVHDRLIVMTLCSSAMDKDLSLLGVTSKSLSMCGEAVKYHGGAFDFCTSSSEGIKASFSWPAKRSDWQTSDVGVQTSDVGAVGRIGIDSRGRRSSLP